MQMEMLVVAVSYLGLGLVFGAAAVPVLPFCNPHWHSPCVTTMHLRHTLYPPSLAD